MARRPSARMGSATPRFIGRRRGRAGEKAGIVPCGVRACRARWAAEEEQGRGKISGVQTAEGGSEVQDGEGAVGAMSRAAGASRLGLAGPARCVRGGGRRGRRRDARVAVSGGGIPGGATCGKVRRQRQPGSAWAARRLAVLPAREGREGGGRTSRALWQREGGGRGVAVGPARLGPRGR